jgi:arylsulfatase
MGELLTENQKGKPGYEGHLNDRVVSLAEVLRQDGYHTYMSGKWHLGHEEGALPFDRGFESSFSMLVGGASHWADMLGILPRDDPASYSLNGKHIHELPADHYSSRSFADHLMESIRKKHGDGKPFLVTVNLFSRTSLSRLHTIRYTHLSRGFPSIRVNMTTGMKT